MCLVLFVGFKEIGDVIGSDDGNKIGRVLTFWDAMYHTGGDQKELPFPQAQVPCIDRNGDIPLQNAYQLVAIVKMCSKSRAVVGNAAIMRGF